MSTVVALGHFCEVHGPRLVFYTIRNNNEPQFVSQCPDLKFCSGCKAPLLEGYISTVQTVHSTPTQTPSESPLEVSGGPGGPANHLSSSSSGQSVRTAPFQSSASRRRTSSNVVIDDGIGSTSPATATSTTNPAGATKYYCSHSNYDHSHLSHLHTCIARTLSCELSPSNSVAFTSSEIWVIGTAFSLKDSQARGFHRRYCLIFTFLPDSNVICTGIGHATAHSAETRSGAKSVPPPPPPKGSGGKSRNPVPGRSGREDYYSDGDFKSSGSNYYPSLVPYYEYITEEFYNVAKSLQSECEKVYFKEQSVSPQRAIRLSTLLDGSLSTGGPSSSATVPGATRGGAKVFTRNHSTGAGARSLPLLTSNPHVFLDLHEKFARILHHVDL
ncbi:unnamed protein product [Allacma fusca]|uniref:Folliculin/SMCR8 longin domain-containing protein n=1 Tax=Allacma fusca TaxID=39272 RepID=A0A8J2KYS3_9HEXA|nr:unnamed protein product [Allacma fusca]